MADDKVFNGLDDETEAIPAPVVEEPKDETPEKAPAKATKVPSKKKAEAAEEEDHIIRLHDSAEFPPGGLTVGVNGKFYRLRADQDMQVPASVLEVLDHAVRTEARLNDHGQVVGQRNVPRFPYTMVRSK